MEKRGRSICPDLRSILSCLPSICRSNNDVLLLSFSDPRLSRHGKPLNGKIEGTDLGAPPDFGSGILMLCEPVPDHPVLGDERPSNRALVLFCNSSMSHLRVEQGGIISNDILSKLPKMNLLVDVVSVLLTNKVTFLCRRDARFFLRLTIHLFKRLADDFLGRVIAIRQAVE